MGKKQLIAAGIADNTGNVQKAARLFSGDENVGCAAHLVNLVAHAALDAECAEQVTRVQVHSCNCFASNSL